MRRKKRDASQKPHRIAIDDAGDAPEDDLARAADAPPAPDDLDVEGIMQDVSADAAALIRRLENERDDALAARQRALADYVNFQRRSSENERRALARGAADIVRALIPVLDHFDLALSQDSASMTVEQLRDGVQIVRNEFTRLLEAQGVEAIAPAPGDEFDPMQHEAMMRQASADIPPNHIVTTLQAGYRLGEMVVRPAKVIIAEAAGEGAAAPMEEVDDLDDAEDLEDSLEVSEGDEPEQE